MKRQCIIAHQQAHIARWFGRGEICKLLGPMPTFALSLQAPFSTGEPACRLTKQTNGALAEGADVQSHGLCTLRMAWWKEHVR